MLSIHIHVLTWRVQPLKEENFPLMETHICVLVVEWEKKAKCDKQKTSADRILIFWMPDAESNPLFSSHCQLSFLT